MFVKIKLEAEGAPHIFHIDENLDVLALKQRVIDYVDIPVENQEIHTLSRILGDNEKLDAILRDLQNINGAAIYLYNKKEFACFLQFYTDSEGDMQTDFFNSPVADRKRQIDQLPKYTEVIPDSEDSWHSTNTDSSDDQSSSSSSSSESSNDEGNHRSQSTRKRKEVEENRVSVSPKRFLITPEVAAKELSSISSPINPLKQPEVAKQSATISPPINPPKQKEVVNKSATNSSPINLPRENDVVKESATIPSPMNPTKDSLQHPSEIPEYLNLTPENRRYALIITNELGGIKQAELDRLMVHFYKLFETSEASNRLNFNDQASITLHEQKLWVICEDNETCEWINKATCNLSPFKCANFINYFDLVKSCVVVPQAVQHKDIASIFQLLELQNVSLSTLKWCVVKRDLLKTKNFESAIKVSTLCENEQLTVYVDRDSKEFIQAQGSRLKYCFWKLVFSF
ncbi:uncharacterized protein LOC115624068 [Scaptodrosophila lebanonensis]|uniref:Uncharacterized protein LOC115624068 n=1 Tax=Drosophila lebanonensis TaxID=7225 RepID=A0A6J2TEU2_DROLE|nr:uncharacterized protein LOC115624068 [Scaptodrosophila lebanonensis]